MNLTNLTLDEVNLLLYGLGELPAKTSLQLILKIQEQIKPQLTTDLQPETTQAES